MPKYAFTSRQQQFLTDLAEKFQQGMGSQMTLILGDDDVQGAFAWGGNERIQPPKFNLDDLPDYEHAGLMRIDSYKWNAPEKVSFYKQLVIETVQKGFEIHPSQRQGVDARTVNVQTNNGVIGFDSHFESIVQTINVGTALPSDEKEQLTELFTRLASELELIDDADAKEAIELSAQDVATAVSQEQPNKTRLKVTAEGLIKAAETVGKIAPPILATATAIAKVIASSQGVPL